MGLVSPSLVLMIRPQRHTNVKIDFATMTEFSNVCIPIETVN